MKKSLILLFTIFLCVMNGACLTSALYSSNKPPLNETITGFLVTADQKQLIFVGQHYHYIFPLPDDLKNILAWSGRGQLEASNLHFTISRGNVINGSYRLELADQVAVSNDDLSFLLAHGFTSSRTFLSEKLKLKQNVNSKLPAWVDPKILPPQGLNTNGFSLQPSENIDAPLAYNGKLAQGAVYDVGHFQLPSLVAFKEPYHLSIDYNYSSVTVGKILLTPLTLATDGVIVVVGATGAVVVGVVAAPIALIGSLAHK